VDVIFGRVHGKSGKVLKTIFVAAKFGRDHEKSPYPCNSKCSRKSRAAPARNRRGNRSNCHTHLVNIAFRVNA